MLIRTLLALLIFAGPVSAQSRDLQNGQDLFMYFCAECHGKEGNGSGPLAEMLSISPPDLTRLAQRNDDLFPTQAVAMQVDGRVPLVLHGDMPMFGPVLDSDRSVEITLPDSQSLLVSLPLADLIAYLEAIQVEH